ncbi:MAG: hypothetical protein HUU20_18265 [Pirellulales bacterium]|nr:hypothetical protein [Pirellulales bacterium]
MPRAMHLAIAVCLLIGGPFCSGTVSIANAEAARPIIGLCYRDGTSGIVLEEVLKAEGVPYVRLNDLGRLEEFDLKGLVLAEGFDSSAGKITRFLEKGGTLLALRPAGGLAEALGLEEVGVQKDGYLAVEGNQATRISYQGRLQLFGSSKLYRGGENLARLDPSDQFGGILRVNRGSATGLVVAFDLPTTLLTILQPEAACGKHIEASNVEYDLGHVPQVDVLRRLVVGLLQPLDRPVLRKWYFPAQSRAMLVPVGDQDGATFEMLQVVADLIEELETPYTLYILQGGRPVTKEQFDTLAKSGMEFGLHPNFFKREGIKFDEEELSAQLKRAEADTGRQILGQRPHSGRWDTIHELPLWCEKLGIQYDSVLGDRWWESKPMRHGYWVGTGMPYHFIDPSGYRRMNVLEIPVFSGDNTDFWKPHQYTVAYKPGARKTFVSGLGLSEDEAFQLWKAFFDEALEKYPAAYGYCWHPVYLAAKELKMTGDRIYPTDTHFRKCVRYAKSRGAGLIGANAWNDFWRAREKVSLEPVAWEPASATIQYRVSGEVKVDRLTLAAPVTFRGKKARIRVNDAPREYVEAGLPGGPQALFSVDVGREELLVTLKYD